MTKIFEYQKVSNFSTDLLKNSRCYACVYKYYSEDLECIDNTITQTQRDSAGARSVLGDGELIQINGLIGQ